MSTVLICLLLISFVTGSTSRTEERKWALSLIKTSMEDFKTEFEDVISRDNTKLEFLVKLENQINDFYLDTLRDIETIKEIASMPSDYTDYDEFIGLYEEVAETLEKAMEVVNAKKEARFKKAL